MKSNLISPLGVQIASLSSPIDTCHSVGPERMLLKDSFLAVKEGEKDKERNKEGTK